MTYTVEEKTYSLKFPEAAPETVEENLKISLLTLIAERNGLPIKLLKEFFVIGLIDAKTKKPVDQKKAQTVFDIVKRQIGISQLVGDITKQLTEDCPFLFQLPRE